jgi:hypothetical protein
MITTFEKNPPAENAPPSMRLPARTTTKTTAPVISPRIIPCRRLRFASVYAPAKHPAQIAMLDSTARIPAGSSSAFTSAENTTLQKISANKNANTADKIDVIFSLRIRCMGVVRISHPYLVTCNYQAFVAAKFLLPLLLIYGALCVIIPKNKKK